MLNKKVQILQFAKSGPFILIIASVEPSIFIVGEQYRQFA